MKTLNALLITLFAMSLFSGCSEDTATPNTYTIQDVWPLKVGNTWTYKNTEFTVDGKAVEKDSFTFAFDSTIIFKGSTAFIVTNSESSVIYYSGPDLYTGEVKSNRSDLFARYPMYINETIVLRDTLYSSGYRSKDYLRFISSNTTINVPAGTFNCIGYETINMYGLGNVLDTTSRRNYYFSFGVGLIKGDDYDISSIDSTWYHSGTYELTSYSKQP